MDTKLKNNNKRGNLLTVIVLLISSVGMLLFYPAFSSYITDQDQKEMRKEEQMLDMLDPILDGNYLLYNEISNETESSEVIEEYGNSRFGLMKKYMKYGIFDESGTAMLTSDESAKSLTVIRMHCVFAFRLMLTEIFPISRWAEQHMIKTSSLRQSNGCMTTAFIQRRRLIFRLRRR